jgi:FtsH-binding integral membrane protein
VSNSCKIATIILSLKGTLVMRLNVAATPVSESTLATNKVLRNTYMLLSMTLLFSAMTAGLAMMLNMPSMVPIYNKKTNITRCQNSSNIQ